MGFLQEYRVGMKLEMVSVARSTILFIMVLIREVLVSMPIKDALIDLKLAKYLADNTIKCSEYAKIDNL